MRFNWKVTGDPVAEMAREILAAEVAVTRGVDRAGKGLREDWRRQVSAALGQRISKTIQARKYPERGESIRAASLVYAPSRRARVLSYRAAPSATASEVIDAHDRGAVIRSATGFWLAIPVGKAANMRGADTVGRGDRTRITPGGYERRTGRQLRFVFRKGQPSLLVDEGKKAPGNVMLWKKGRGGGRYAQPRGFRNRIEIVFLLVPQVRLRKKTDLDRDTEKWANALPGLILSNWKDV